jgi:mono/diheme cytochrome c family protein
MVRMIGVLGASLALSGAALAATPGTAPTPAPVSGVGEAVYAHWCAPCHAPGPGHPGTESLQLKYNGLRPAVLLDRTDLAAPAVAAIVRQGVLLMAPFRKTEITDEELQLLAAYVAGNYGKAR